MTWKIYIFKVKIRVCPWKEINKSRKLWINRSIRNIDHEGSLPESSSTLFARAPLNNSYDARWNVLIMIWSCVFECMCTYTMLEPIRNALTTFQFELDSTANYVLVDKCNFPSTSVYFWSKLLVLTHQCFYKTQFQQVFSKLKKGI